MDAGEDRGEDGPVTPPEHLAGLTGMDLVRRTLEEARGVARSQGKNVGRGRNSPAPRRVAGRRRSWSGPGPDNRDPQTLGAATQDLAKTRGWSGRVAEGTVFGRWPTVVGEQIAAHATPTACGKECSALPRNRRRGRPNYGWFRRNFWLKLQRRSATEW